MDAENRQREVLGLIHMAMRMISDHTHTPLTREEAKTRANRGASLLDQHRPGWHHRIDEGTLNQSSPMHCAGAQTFGTYDNMLAYFKWPEMSASDIMRHYERCQAAPQVAHGFMLVPSRLCFTFGSNDGCSCAKDWKTLTGAWIECIAERRYPDMFSVPAQFDPRLVAQER